MTQRREVAAGFKARQAPGLAVSGSVPEEKGSPVALGGHPPRYVTSERFNSGKSDQEAVIPTMPEFVATVSYGKMRGPRSGAQVPARARTQQQPPRDTAGSIIDS